MSSKNSVMQPGADAGFANALLAIGGYFGLSDADVRRVRTLFEAWNLHRRGYVGSLDSHWLEDTVAIHGPVTRGADHVVRLDPEELSRIFRGMVWAIPPVLMSYLRRRQYLDYENQGLDYRSMGEVLRIVRELRTSFKEASRSGQNR